jgi:murein DD-endopeptidase MepM/ murein hydrolase activator NlpD
MTPARRPLHLLLALAATAFVAAPAAAGADEPTTVAATETTAPAVTTETAPAPAPSTGSQPAAPTTSEAPAPEVQSEHAQGTSVSGAHKPGHTHAKTDGQSPGVQGAEPGQPGSSAEPPPGKRAPKPSALTPSLPLALRESIAGVPGFFIESFQIPPFLLPIFQAAGTAYGVPWQVLASINEVETDYGRDLSTSSAGAEGWMQFLPAEWQQYGVDANGDGFRDPYNPADAIFSAARYLRAAGGNTNIRAAILSYNHSQQYVESVMLRAQLLGGTPSELLGAITGLTEAHFPVHAPSHFSDGFPSVTAAGTTRTLPGTTIYSQAGAPVIAVQDGEIVQFGDSPSLGHFVSLRDAYGNTYVYAQLGDVASVYPVIKPRVHSAVSARIDHTGAAGETAPSGPATAGAQPRSPISEGATVSGLALGAAAGLEPAPTAPAPAPAPAAPAPAPQPAKEPGSVSEFAEGSNDVYLRSLVAGVQVIAGTVLGHVASTDTAPPHIIFQIRPAGAGAQLIDPKPILDGWVALENTSIFRARGENPFLATSPTVGQVLLESKQQLGPQVLHDHGVRLSTCAREDVQGGRVDRRVLAMLEYLSVSGLKPTVSGLPCSAATTANAGASGGSEAV